MVFNVLYVVKELKMKMYNYIYIYKKEKHIFDHEFYYNCTNVRFRSYYNTENGFINLNKYKDYIIYGGCLYENNVVFKYIYRLDIQKIFQNI